MPEILLETEIKKMGGRWKTYLYPFSFRRPRTHLAVPDALWGTHRTELHACWPLDDLFDFESVGFWKLAFRVRGKKGKDRQWFKFKNKKELAVWRKRSSLVSQLPGEPARPNSSRRRTLSKRMSPRPTLARAIDPILALSRSCCSRPGRARDFSCSAWSRAKAPDRNAAAAGLAIRGAMMGADAIVDFNQERLPGIHCARTSLERPGRSRRRRRRPARAQNAMVF